MMANVVTARHGLPTAKPSWKVYACTIAAALVPIAVALLNKFVFESEVIDDAQTAALTTAIVFISGYQTPPADSEGATDVE